MKEKYKNLKVLHLVLEFSRWKRSRSWAYSAQFSLNDGLKQHGIDCFTINTMCLPVIKNLCKGKKFDQVWLEIVHQPLDKELLEWIAQLAPVRVGFAGESLEYSKADYQSFTGLQELKDNAISILPYLTHAMLIDEKDVSYFGKRKELETMWWISSVPEIFIADEINIYSLPYAFFAGTLYAKRAKWFEMEGLKTMLVKQVSSEANTLYPFLYNSLQFSMFHGSKIINLHDGKIFKKYQQNWLNLRKKCFERWLQKMQLPCASVNLPSAVKAYAGRVYEAMSVGVPVISWKIPNRPKNEALFEHGKEILLFSEDKPEELLAHLQKIKTDKDFSGKIAKAALDKMRTFHTGERRVKEILDWIESGEKPPYH